MGLRPVDEVWNRAAMERGGPQPREGDRHLSALLYAHNMTMNGGLDHALEVLSVDDWAAAIDGYRYFGLSEVADLLENLRDAPEEEIDAADLRYGEIVPDDDTLVSAFEHRYEAAPDFFAPLLR